MIPYTRRPIPNEQMQIVNTKLPNENIQFYQLQMIDSRGGGANYQMQIVIKLPNGPTKVAQNDSEQPILPSSQLFQSLPTTDDCFWGQGKLPNANCEHQTTK